MMLIMMVLSTSLESRRRHIWLAGVGSAAAFSLCVTDMRVLPVRERGRENKKISYFLDFE